MCLVLYRCPPCLRDRKVIDTVPVRGFLTLREIISHYLYPDRGDEAFTTPPVPPPFAAETELLNCMVTVISPPPLHLPSVITY